MHPSPPPRECPECGHWPPAGATVCPECELPLHGPVADQLARVLGRLDASQERLRALEAEHDELVERRREDLDERDGLVAQLRRARADQRAQRARAARHAPPPPLEAPPEAVPPGGPPPQVQELPAQSPRPVPAPPAPPTAPPAPAAAPAPPRPRAPRRPRLPRPRREFSPPSAQNILLGLGGLLIAIAAVVFTIVTWSQLGLGVRALILAGFTAATGYTARPLHRNGMVATAETFGALTTALLAMTGVAIGLTLLGADPNPGGVDPGADPNPGGYGVGASATSLGLASIGTALAAAAFAAYPRLVAPLRGPRIVAVLLLQATAPLAALALVEGEYLGWPAVLAACAVTAGGDLVIHRVMAVPGAGPWRRRIGTLAWILGVVSWWPAVLPAVVLGAVTVTFDPTESTVDMVTTSAVTWPAPMFALAATVLALAGGVALAATRLRVPRAWRAALAALPLVAVGALMVPGDTPTVATNTLFLTPGSRSASVVALALAGAVALAAARLRSVSPWRPALIAATAGTWIAIPPVVLLGRGLTLGEVTEPAISPAWFLPILALSAAVTAGEAGFRTGRRGRLAVGLPSAAWLALGAVPLLPVLGEALIPALDWADHPWFESGASWPPDLWPPMPVAAGVAVACLLALAISAAGWALLAWSLRQRWPAVVALAVAAAAPLAPMVSDTLLPYAPSAALVTAATVVLLGIAVVAHRRGHAWLSHAALVLAGLEGLLAIGYSLFGPVPTVATGGVLVAATAVAACVHAGRAVQAAGAASAVVLLAGETVAVLAWLKPSLHPGAGTLSQRFPSEDPASALTLLAIGAAATLVATALDQMGRRATQVRALDAAAFVPLAGALLAAGTVNPGFLTLVAALAALSVLLVVGHGASLREGTRVSASFLVVAMALGVALGTLPLLVHATADHLRHVAAPWAPPPDPLVSGQPGATETWAALILITALVIAAAVSGRARGAPAAMVGGALAAVIGAAWLPGTLMTAAVTTTAAAALAVAVLAERRAHRVPVPVPVHDEEDSPRSSAASRGAAVHTAVAGGGAAGVTAVLAVASSLATPGATVAVLGALLAATAIAALVRTGHTLQAATAASVVVLLTAETVALLAWFSPVDPYSTGLLARFDPSQPATALSLLVIGGIAVLAATALDLAARRPAQVAALDVAAALPLGGALLAAGAVDAGFRTLVTALVALPVLLVAAHRVSLDAALRAVAAAAAGLLGTGVVVGTLPLLGHATVDHLRRVPAPWGPQPAPLFPGQPGATETWAALLLMFALVVGAMASGRGRGAPAAVGGGALAALVAATWLPGLGATAAVATTAVAALATAVLAERRARGATLHAGEDPAALHAGPRAAARRSAVVGVVCAGVVAVLAAAASLTGPAATIAVTAALTVAALVAGAVRTGALTAVTGAAGTVVGLSGVTVASFVNDADAGAASLAAGLLTVAAIAVGAATALARAGQRREQVVALDVTAALPAALAIGFALPEGRGLTALVIGVSALLTLVTAAHPRLGAAPGSGRERLATSAGLGVVALGFLAPRLAAILTGWMPSVAYPWLTPIKDLGGIVSGRHPVTLPAISLWDAPQFSPPERALRFDTAQAWLESQPQVPLLLPALAVTLAVLALCAIVHTGARRLDQVLAWGGAAAGLMVPPLLTEPSNRFERSDAVADPGAALGTVLVSPEYGVVVSYGVALGVLVAATGALLAGAARARGAGARALLASGTLLAVSTAGWSTVAPAPTLWVLGSLSVLAIAAAVVVRPRTPASVAGTLAYLAGLASGAMVVTAYGALLRADVGLDPRWQPFTGLAMAALIASLVRVHALRERPAQRGGLIAAGLTLVLVSSFTAPSAPGLPGLVAAAAGLLLLAFALALPGWVGRVVGGVGAFAGLGALVSASPGLLWALLQPYAWLGAPWSLAPADVAGLAGVPASEIMEPSRMPVHYPSWSADVALQLPTVTTVGAGVLLAVRMWVPRRLPHVAAVAAPPVLVPFPIAVTLGEVGEPGGVLGLPYPVALGWTLLVAAGLAVAAARAERGGLAAVCGVAALWPLSLATAWGLTAPPATLAALAGGVVIAAAAAAWSRTVVSAAGATATAVLLTGAFAFALPRAFDQPLAVAALAPIAVVAGVAATVGMARLDARVLLSAEIPAGVIGAVSVVLTLSGTARPELTSAALACLGVVSLLSAPRPGRAWLGAVGPVLMLVALWVFLGWARITDPEPYTAVPALAALAAGWEWRRRRPDTGTWRAYGAPLGLLLGPSLVLLYVGDSDLWRVVLLGAVALATMLLGAWWRMQAPTLLGAVSLLALAVKSPGPPVWQFVWSLPNWIPPAVIGVLLVYLGARYERHLKNLRSLGRMVREMR